MFFFAFALVLVRVDLSSGNGANSLLFGDVNQLLRTSTPDVMVSGLWLPNQQGWNDQLIDNLFQQPMVQCIKQTTIIHSNQNDSLCWKLTHNGKCCSKSAYYACLQNLQEHGEPESGNRLGMAASPRGSNLTRSTGSTPCPICGRGAAHKLGHPR
jgi:hypothetical protein